MALTIRFYDMLERSGYCNALATRWAMFVVVLLACVVEIGYCWSLLGVLLSSKVASKHSGARCLRAPSCRSILLWHISNACRQIIESCSSRRLATLLRKHPLNTTDALGRQLQPFKSGLSQPLTSLDALDDPLRRNESNSLATSASDLFLDLGACQSAATAFSCRAGLAYDDVRDGSAAKGNAELTTVQAEEVLEFVVGDMWGSGAVDVEGEAGEDLRIGFRFHWRICCFVYFLQLCRRLCERLLSLANGIPG